MTERFACDIGNCGEYFFYTRPYPYFEHIKEEHGQTYRENKDYVDAKLTVLRNEDFKEVPGKWGI